MSKGEASPMNAACIEPCIVFDTETTGFPGDGGFFRARVIEVGAVVITADARVVSPINFFVWQSMSHLSHPQAKRAMDVHQISAAEIQRDGLRPEMAASRLAAWIERVQQRHNVTEARAYNQGFDFWFLKRSPWKLFERTELDVGQDIKQSAHQVMKAAGATRRPPSLAHAVDFLAERGHNIEWAGDAHRAMEDARMAALCAIGFATEQADGTLGLD